MHTLGISGRIEHQRPRFVVAGQKVVPMSAITICSTGRGTRGLWAVTCLFNPIGYRRRLQNYRVFRQRLGVPLVTVELSFDGRFQLQPGDAEILVQLTGGDILWQKERLLNVALQSLPGNCDRVAWIDCDVIFESADWVERASRALDELALVHLYTERHDLPPEAVLESRGPSPATMTGWSSVHLLATGGLSPEELSLSGPSGPGKLWWNGLAWAGRRDLLEQHGLYDAYILGSGDRGILWAALGWFEQAVRYACMGGRRREHYLAWAGPFFDSVQGRVGFIHGRIFHLWHGDLGRRRYGDRHRQLQDAAFDPYTDIAVAANGCWRWSSDKPQLHQLVRRYFESRKEDGEGHPCTT
jgi:hypothetical protein